jgi:hypothetical protein
MATFGPVVKVPLTPSSGGVRQSVMLARSILFRCAMLGVALILLDACATSFHAGSPPPVERLASLKPGVSTRAQVTATLGTPQGQGNALSSSRPEVQDLLVYQYVETDGQQVRTRNLLVFVDKQSGLYQGYMWFRSGQVFGVNQ